MQFHILRDEIGHRTMALIFEAGDPVIETLQAFMDQWNLRAGYVTALGAFETATLAYFDRERKEYLEIPVEEQMEVASLTGSLARDDEGKARAHVHCVLSRRSGETVAGHLVEGTVWPTLELFLQESNTAMIRRPDEESELELIRK